MYTLLLALIYLAFISLGLPDSLLGSGWPVMHEVLHVPISFMGIISMIISGSTIVSSLLSERLTRKFGTQFVTLASVFLTAFALLGFSVSNHFWMLVVFAIPYGFGGGSIDAALNSYVALHYTSKHMGWLHCFWGVGTIVSPFVMSYSLTHATWNNGYRVIAGLQFLIGLILLFTLPVWKKNQKNSEESTKIVGLKGALKIKGVRYILLGFFAYCAAEGTAMHWASTYMVEVKDISTSRAARFAALFYIGITFGRFLSGFIMNKLGDRKMIILGTCMIGCGIVTLMIPSNNPVVSLIGLLIIGFGCAPIYPCIIHSTPSNFGAENAGAIIGIQMASAYVGSTFMPPLFGVLGYHISFRVFPIFLVVFFALMIYMTEKTFRTTQSS